VVTTSDTNAPDARRRPFARWAGLARSAAILFAILFAGALGWWWSAAPPTVRLAVVGGGDSERLVRALDARSAAGRWQVRIRAVVLPDPLAASRAITGRQADAAVLRADAPLPEGVQLAAIWRRNLVIMVAPPDSGVREFADLADKTIAVVGRDPANLRLASMLLALNGIAADPARLRQTPLDDLPGALSRQEVQAAVLVGPSDARLAPEIVRALRQDASGAPVFVAIRNAPAIARQNPRFESTEIQAGTFGAAPLTPEADVPTIGVPHLVLVRRQLPNATVTAFVRTLFDARPTLAADFPAVTRIVQPDTERDRLVPVHRGANFYFNEEDEKTFFETYSDLLWLFVFGSGFFASIGAWLWQKIRPPGAPNLGSEPQLELLDLAAEARRAADAAELEAVERRIDDTLRRALSSHSPFGAEGSDRVRLAVEHATRAVEQRRAQLANEGRVRAAPAA
jgi:TRAP-type uncharacterized transport system substrate-binding protein